MKRDDLEKSFSHTSPPPKTEPPRPRSLGYNPPPDEGIKPPKVITPMPPVKTGGPAFPRVGFKKDPFTQDWVPSQKGMTLWDYYAAHAPFEGIISTQEEHKIGQGLIDFRAGFAAAYADAIIVLRKKRGIA